MTSSEVPPEVWTRIFEFVKRDVPPPWQYADWSDLHQHDLASVCRVSPLFHSLATPLLYRSMVLPDLTILIKELRVFATNYRRPTSLKTTPLEALLTRTHTLRIAGLPPRPQSKIKLEDLLRNGKWDKVGAKEKAESLARKAVVAPHRIFHKNRSLVTVPVFTNLQHVILGQKSHTPWKYWAETDADERLEYACDAYFDAFISAHSLTSLCTHNSEGPYSFGTNRSAFLAPRSAANPPIVTRHAYAHFEKVVIIPGAKNRWTYYPGSVTDPKTNIYGYEVWPEYNRSHELLCEIGNCLSQLKRQCEEAQMQGPATKTWLDMYGPAAWGPSAKERLHQAVHGADPAGSLRAANSTDPGIFEEGFVAQIQHHMAELAWETQANASLVDNAHDTKWYPNGEEWHRFVQFHLWEEVPPCDCCGWDREDCMDELTAGLNPRERIFRRALMGLGEDRGQKLEIEIE